MKKTLPILLFSAGVLAAAAAHAQVRVEIAGVASNQIPIAVAAFADEGVAPAQVSAIIKADLERSGVFKVIDAGTSCRKPRRSTTASGNRAAPMRWWWAACTRWPTAASTCATSCSTPSRRPSCRPCRTRCSRSTPACGAQDRRRHLRKTDRHARRLRHPHRLRHPDQQQATTASKWPTPTAKACRSRCARQRADHLAVLVARRQQGRLRLVRTAQAGRLRAGPGHRRAQGDLQRKRQQLGAVLVARRQQAGGDPVEGRPLAGLRRERRRQRPAPPVQQQRHRHRAAIFGRRPEHLFHQRPQRRPADLQDERQRRQRHPRHLQRQLQHQPARVLRRQDAGLDLAARRRLFACTRWTWPAARNCAWPTAPPNRVFRRTANTSCTQPRVAAAPAWPWCRSMDESSSA